MIAGFGPTVSADHRLRPGDGRHLLEARPFGAARDPLALIIAPTRELALQVRANWAGCISMRARASYRASAAWIRGATSRIVGRRPYRVGRRAACAITLSGAP